MDSPEPQRLPSLRDDFGPNNQSPVLPYSRDRSQFLTWANRDVPGNIPAYAPGSFSSKRRRILPECEGCGGPSMVNRDGENQCPSCTYRDNENKRHEDAGDHERRAPENTTQNPSYDTLNRGDKNQTYNGSRIYNTREYDRSPQSRAIVHVHVNGSSPSTSTSNTSSPPPPSSHPLISNQDILDTPPSSIPPNTNGGIEPTEIRSQLYQSLLLQCGLGYPMWQPSPRRTSEGEYIVNIGDVGVIRNDFPFNTLFNITQPLDSMANKDGVPEEGVDPPCVLQPRWLTKNGQYHQEGTMIVRPKNAVIDEESVEMDHPSRLLLTDTHGVLLHLPQGGALENLENRKEFIRRIQAHWRSWYKFADEQVDLDEGQPLYLVTGRERCSSWAIATWYPQPRPATTTLELESRKSSNPARVETRWMNGEGGKQKETVFTRGFWINRSSGGPTEAAPWRPYQEGNKDGSGGGSNFDQDKGNGPARSRSSPDSSHSSSYSFTSSSSGGGYYGEMSHAATRPMGAIISPAQVNNPCEMINIFSLAIASQIKPTPFEADNFIAFCHDDDWLGIVDEADEVFPSREELIQRVIRRVKFVVENDAIYTETLSTNDVRDGRVRQSLVNIWGRAIPVSIEVCNTQAVTQPSPPEISSSTRCYGLTEPLEPPVRHSCLSATMKGPFRMDSVPYEILQMIFHFASDLGRPHDTFLLKSGDDSKPVIYSASLQVKISHVCKKWRTVALESPYLWNRLHFDRPSDIERGKAFVERAKKFKLDILILTVSERQYSESIEKGEPALWIDELEAVFSFLGQETKRWRSFHLQVRDGACQAIARKYIGTQNGEICGPAPNLQAWQLYHFEDYHNEEELHEATFRPPVVCFEDHIPMLNHLSLIGVNFPWGMDSLKGLRSLELCLHPNNIRPEFVHWHKILTRSPDLESIFLHYSGPKFGEEPWPKLPIIMLPRLQRLGFVDIEPDHIRAITTTMETPHVRRLELELASTDPEDDSILLSYDGWLTSISTPIPHFQSVIYLTITSLTSTDPSLKLFLGSLPQLRELELKYAVWLNVWKMFVEDLKWRGVRGPDGTPLEVSASGTPSPDAQENTDGQGQGHAPPLLLPNLEVLKVRGTRFEDRRANVKLLLRFREREGGKDRHPSPSLDSDRHLFTVVGTLPVQVVPPALGSSVLSERNRQIKVLTNLFRLKGDRVARVRTSGAKGNDKHTNWRMLVDIEEILDDDDDEDKDYEETEDSGGEDGDVSAKDDQVWVHGIKQDYRESDNQPQLLWHEIAEEGEGVWMTGGVLQKFMERIG